jgi:hypothetical protein
MQTVATTMVTMHPLPWNEFLAIRLVADYKVDADKSRGTLFKQPRPLLVNGGG